MYKDNNNKAKFGESFVYQKLIENGIKAKWVAFSNRRSTADFITEDGKTIDVKYSETQKIKGKKNYKYWSFNCHHHGKKQVGIDFFICLLFDLPKPLIFIFPSKIITGFQIHISQLKLKRGTYDYFLENWDLIKESAESK